MNGARKINCGCCSNVSKDMIFLFMKISLKYDWSFYVFFYMWQNKSIKYKISKKYNWLIIKCSCVNFDEHDMHQLTQCFLEICPQWRWGNHHISMNEQFVIKYDKEKRWNLWERERREKLRNFLQYTYNWEKFKRQVSMTVIVRCFDHEIFHACQKFSKYQR